MSDVHILIAEDEKHVRHSMGLALRMAGYQVTMAEDGQEALDRLLELAAGSAPVDMLITDIQMPRLDGLLLLDNLKDKGIAIPVVGITGFGDKELVVELLRRGCRDFLDKPFAPGDILSLVEKVLQQEQAGKAARENRLRQMEIDRLNLQQEVRKHKENFERLWKRGSIPQWMAYRRLISYTRGTRKLPLAWRNQPMAALGGDYLDIHDTRVGCDILLADVAGHDMEAFYNAVLIKSFFEDNRNNEMELQTFFRLLNLHLLERGRKERLVKAIFLRLDLENRQGYVISAAHSPLIADSRQGLSVRQLPAEGSLLGIFTEVDFSEHRFPLLAGDRYFLCSDGVINARRSLAQQSRLRADGLIELIARTRGKTIKAAVREIWTRIQNHAGGFPQDDMAFLGLEIPDSGK
jgi:FixJ family two-component response regulator